MQKREQDLAELAHGSPRGTAKDFNRKGRRGNAEDAKKGLATDFHGSSRIEMQEEILKNKKGLSVLIRVNPWREVDFAVARTGLFLVY